MAKGEGGGWRPGGGGSGGPKRRGPKADWMPTAEKPKSRKRHVLIAALFLVFAGIVGGIAYLVYRLRDPSPPVLLIITTDPGADAPNLSAPIDPYGFMSGKDLEEWSGRNREGSTDSEKSHAPVSSNGSDKFRTDDISDAKTLSEWVVGETRHSGKFRKPSEAAILYFGLHTGATADRPYVYVNKGRTIPVEDLLREISSNLGSTKALVLFDPARQTPEPVRGHLHDGFVQAMKSESMNNLLMELGNIVVILGCDEGERAWESEELKRTAFAHGLIQGLCGKGTIPTSEKYVNANDLFKSVRDSVKKWSAQNRPTSQTPLLLPKGPTGEQRAAGMSLMLRREIDDKPSAEHDPVPGMVERWNQYRDLAAMRPAPEVYTPRHWRRYRELLLRYEHTARSGHTESAKAVGVALDDEVKAIQAAGATNFISDEARIASAPMWQASGAQAPITGTHNSELLTMGNVYIKTAAPDALKEVQGAVNQNEHRVNRMAYSAALLKTMLNALPGTEFVDQDPPAGDPNKHSQLKRRALLLRALWGDQRVRPPDVQLVLMLHQFSELSGEKWPSEKDPRTQKMLWQRAVLVRQMAEEAALGPVAPGKHPYSEVVWRVVQDVVKSADASRRRAEDLLFARPDQRIDIFKHYDLAETLYNRARDRATSLRDALALRDEVMADLPFLGRWVIFQDESRYDPKPLLKLWADVHALAEALDQLPNDRPEDKSPEDRARESKLKGLVDEVTKAHALLADRYEVAIAGEAKKPVSLQDDWLRRERLLQAPPLRRGSDSIAMDRRKELVRANRVATRSFLAVENKAPDSAKDDKQKDINRRDRAVALGFLALSELGRAITDLQKQENIKFTSWDVIGAEVNKISEKSWKESALAGEQLQEHYKALSERATPAATDAKAPEAERFSRSAVLPELRSVEEPAVVNRNHRWLVLFAGQAHRAVEDHWYDDAESARPDYFRAVADAYLAPPAGSDKDADAAQQKLYGMTDPQYAAFKSLRAAKLLELDVATDAASWTTEQNRKIAFTLTSGPVPAGAAAVEWAALEPKTVANRTITLERKERTLVSLKQDQTEHLHSTLKPPMNGKPVRESATVRQKLFFRGQYRPKDGTADLKRVPDVIATHAPPTEEPRAAFVGTNDIDVGVVSIIIDYSPSMTKIPEGEKESRLTKLWVELRKVLQSLPDQTEVYVRGFGVAPENPNEKPKKLAYETAATGGGIDKDDPTTVYPGTFDRSVYKGIDGKRFKKVDWGANLASLDTFITSLKGVQVYEPKPNAPGAWSPIIRSMVNAVREDFADAKVRNQRMMVVVLTDGADNSHWSYAKDSVSYLHTDSMEALRREFTEGEGKNISAHILLIKDALALQDKNIDAFHEAAKAKLESFETHSSIVFESLDKFADTLREYLRPRIILKADGRKAFETVYRYDTPEREPPMWGQPLEVEQYDAYVRRPPAGGAFQLALGRGDRLMVRVSRNDQSRPPIFERLLWSKYARFGTELINSGRTHKDPVEGWYLSLPRYGATEVGHQSDYIDASGRKTVDITAAVERVRTDDERLLKLPAPGFAWWELRSDAVRSEGATLYTWREYKYPAPAWRVRRWNWVDKNDNEQLARGEITGWVESRPNSFKERETTVLDHVGMEWNEARGGNEGQPWRKAEWDSPEWTVRFNWENHRFHSNPDSDKPDQEEKPRLAVRIYSKKPELLPNGKKSAFFVKVSGAKLEEHQFYREFNAYTAFFELDGPPETVKGRRVQLFSIKDLIDPEKKAGTMLTLPLPRARTSDSDAVFSSWDSPLTPPPPP